MIPTGEGVQATEEEVQATVAGEAGETGGREDLGKPNEETAETARGRREGRSSRSRRATWAASRLAEAGRTLTDEEATGTCEVTTITAGEIGGTGVDEAASL